MADKQGLHSTSLHFTFRGMLRMFKLFPDKFSEQGSSIDAGSVFKLWLAESAFRLRAIAYAFDYKRIIEIMFCCMVCK